MIQISILEKANELTRALEQSGSSKAERGKVIEGDIVRI